MIKMTYSQVMNDGFVQAFQHLARAPLPVKVAYQIKRIGDELSRARRKISDEFKELLEKAGTRFEGESEEDFAKRKETEVEDFGKKEFALDRNQISLESISHLELTAADLMHLDPIYVDLSVVADETDLKASAS